MSLPKTLFRVEFWEGLGSPEFDKRRGRSRSKRTYETAQDASNMVASLQRWPEHHVLIGVYRGDVEWRDLPVEQLPEPRERVA